MLELTNRSGIVTRRAVTAAAVLALSASGLLAAEVDVPIGTTDLSTLAVTGTDDLTFTNITYSPTTIGITANLTAATLNDLNITQALTLNNPTASTSVSLTLNGGTNSVASANGGAASDLIYVPASGSLNIVGTGTGLGTISGITLGAAGNLNVGGTLNLGPAVTWGANAITKTGTGNLILNGVNVGTGGFNINSGTVTVQGTNNTSLGTAGSTLTLGSGANNATLTFTSTPSGIAPNIVVAAGTGARTITASNSATGNGAVFTNPITLNNNLTVSQTGSGTGNIQFRGVISGGNFGITVNNTNATTAVQFRAANTFSGGVTVASGIAQFNTTSSAGAVGAVTSGPFGTGTITLGTGSAAASLVSDSNQSILNNITVASGGTRTIGSISATSTAPTIAGPVTLNSDLTLSAIATTLTTGANRLRIGSGGLNGSGNLIIENANTASGAVAGSGAIRLDGNASPTAWTGSVIVKNGQFSLQSNNALGPNNVVGVAPTGWFNFNDTGVTLSPVIAGLSNATSAGALGGSAGGVVQASVAASRGLTLAGTGNYTFAGTIVNNVNGTNTAGLNINLTSATASQTLSGLNTYSSGTNLTGGTLSVGTLADGGVASNIGASTNIAANLVFQGGKLQYTGTGANTDRLFTVAAPGGTIDSSGTGALVLTNTGGVSVTDNASANYVTTAGSTTVAGGVSFNANALVPGTAITGANLDAGTTITSVNIANNTFTISQPANTTGTAAITFATVNRTLNLTGSNTAANTINAVLGNSTGGATLGVTKSGDGAWVLAGANTYSGKTTVKAGVLTLKTAAQNPVLTGAGGADIQGGSLVLDYTGGSSPVASVKALLDAAYASHFATGQIISSTLSATNTLGYGDNASGQVTIRVTLPGDANLDGQVNFNDFLVLQANFGKPATQFDQGNFNYDGQTDFNDFLLLQSNFGISVTGAAVSVTSAEVAAIQAFAATVPEPTSMMALALGGAAALRRRRR